MVSFLENHLFTCFFKSHFGIECPACGLQRAFIALLKGDLAGSLKYHAALIPFMITLLICAFQLKFRYENGGKVILWSFIISIGITFIQYIIRQLILLT
jgi:hypothetical protein